MNAEWTKFNACGLAFNDYVFLPHNVPGNGNCFYHAIVESQVSTTFFNNILLCHLLFDTILLMYNKEDNIWRLILDKVFRSYNKHIQFTDYVIESRNNRRWATDLEMVLFYLAFGYDVQSISNLPTGFVVFNASTYIDLLGVVLPLNFVKLQQCVYVYYYAHSHPLTIGQFPLDHYCILKEMQNNLEKNQLATNAYRG